MSKMQGLQQALKSSSGKAAPEQAAAPASPKTSVPPKPSKRQGKESISAWLNSDFGISLRMVQLRKRKDQHGNKIFLDDLIAEALNDLFVKYDVPTVHHD